MLLANDGIVQVLCVVNIFGGLHFKGVSDWLFASNYKKHLEAYYNRNRNVR